MSNFETYFKIIFKTFYEFKYILIYSVIFFLIAVLSSSYNIESARSVLNVVIQSLSSILAIIISLTLIAVQLSSQSYSNRILKMFVSCRNNYFWILICLYLFSIAYSIFLLNSIQGTNDLISSFEVIGVSLSILFTIWSLLLIPKYILDTLDRLRPEKVIENLYEEIKEIPIDQLEKLSSDRDHVIPLMDIIAKSIEDGHIDIAETGLIKINDYFLFLYKNKIITTENGKDILNYFLYHIKRAQKAATENSDVRTTELIIEIVSKMGFLIIQKSLNSSSLLIEFFEEMSKNIMSAKFESSINKLMDFFEERFMVFLINIAIREPDDFFKTGYVTKSMNFLNNLWKLSIDEKQLGIKEIVGNRITYIIQRIGGSGIFPIINFEIDFLKEMGLHATKNDPYTLYPVIDGLMAIFWKLYEKGFKKALYSAKDKDFEKNRLNKLMVNLIESLKDIGFKSIKENIYESEWNYYPQYSADGSVIFCIISALKEIGLIYVNEETYKKFDFNKNETIREIVDRVIVYLGEIGLRLAQNESSFVLEVIKALNLIGRSRNTVLDQTTTLNVMDSIEEICLELIKNRTTGDISECTRMLKDLGLFGIKNNFPKVILHSRAYLETITIKLTCSSDLKNDLSMTIEYLENISSKAIFEKDSEKNVLMFASIIRNIAKEIKNKCSDEVDIEMALDPLKFIRELLIKENMDDLAKEIGKWLNEFDNRPIIAFG